MFTPLKCCSISQRSFSHSEVYLLLNDRAKLLLLSSPSRNLIGFLISFSYSCCLQLRQDCCCYSVRVGRWKKHKRTIRAHEGIFNRKTYFSSMHCFEILFISQKSSAWGNFIRRKITTHNF